MDLGGMVQGVLEERRAGLRCRSSSLRDTRSTSKVTICARFAPSLPDGMLTVTPAVDDSDAREGRARDGLLQVVKFVLVRISRPQLRGSLDALNNATAFTGESGTWYIFRSAGPARDCLACGLCRWVSGFILFYRSVC